MALVRRHQPKVELFRQAKLIDSFMPPAGQEIWSVAVSGYGASGAADHSVGILLTGFLLGSSASKGGSKCHRECGS
jgi:hypothetical protein